MFRFSWQEVDALEDSTTRPSRRRSLSKRRANRPEDMCTFSNRREEEEEEEEDIF